jgi:uncharacterized protein with FMN-binding domain
VNRTPIVLGGTIAGLVGVLVFHTTPSKTSFTTLPASSAVSGASSASSAPASSASAKKSSTKKTSAKKSAGASSTPAASSSAASTTRSATGSQVNYSWGVLSVKVTVSGKKITNVGIASLDDGGNPRSQSIDQQSIPILEQEVMQAQSANIQSVSGASYTSAGFVQSLQSALQPLGL